MCCYCNNCVQCSYMQVFLYMQTNQHCCTNALPYVYAGSHHLPRWLECCQLSLMNFSCFRRPLDPVCMENCDPIFRNPNYTVEKVIDSQWGSGKCEEVCRVGTSRDARQKALFDQATRLKLIVVYVRSLNTVDGRGIWPVKRHPSDEVSFFVACFPVNIKTRLDSHISIRVQRQEVSMLVLASPDWRWNSHITGVRMCVYGLVLWTLFLYSSGRKIRLRNR